MDGWESAVFGEEEEEAEEEEVDASAFFLPHGFHLEALIGSVAWPAGMVDDDDDDDDESLVVVTGAWTGDAVAWDGSLARDDTLAFSAPPLEGSLVSGFFAAGVKLLTDRSCVVVRGKLMGVCFAAIVVVVAAVAVVAIGGEGGGSTVSDGVTDFGNETGEAGLLWLATASVAFFVVVVDEAVAGGRIIMGVLRRLWSVVSDAGDAFLERRSLERA